MGYRGTNGCEIHRIKEFNDYDEDLFIRLYNTCKPLVKSLSRNIDPRRFNISQDILESYFWDKFLYVFNKYKNKYGEERLKANLLSSLKTYRNKLLRTAYNGQCQFNQELTSLDELMDINGNKEYLDDSDEVSYNEDLSIRFHEYMKTKLTPDEYLIFVTELDPPKWFEDKIKESRGKLSTLHLIDFFDLPRDKKSQSIISKARKNIKKALEDAKTEFKP